ncbi:MAG: hypothetical protein KME17_02205 [Cyanosarcina radialis HA8281-LM2]|jgi:hypothetical protein|nr:hypothetical protein [Cyanosarcina radialis HA8281-LM2]
MNTKDANKSEPTDVEPLDLIMNNPKATPILLLLLAITPAIAAAVILVLVQHLQ